MMSAANKIFPCSDSMIQNSTPSMILDAVSDIERTFLNGNYSTTLTQCNCYLDINIKTNLRHELSSDANTSKVISNNNNNNDTIVLSLNGPLHFKFDSCPTLRYISIQLSTQPLSGIRRCCDSENRDSQVDGVGDHIYLKVQKVGAITLQSWYELAKKQQQQKQQTQHQQHLYDGDDDDGYRFLQPFLNTFTSVSPTIEVSSSSTDGKLNHCECTMSLELFVIFIRFISSSIVGEEMNAILLSIEFLRHVRSSKSKSTTTVSSSKIGNGIATALEQSCCQEIVIYFFTVLIPQNCHSIQNGSKILDCIKDDSNSNSELLPKIISDMMNESETTKTAVPRQLVATKDVIQLCLQFCNTDDGNWPKWISHAFVQCRILLQRQLREMYFNNQQQVRAPCHNIPNTTSGPNENETSTHTGPNATLTHLPLPSIRATYKSLVEMYKTLCSAVRDSLRQQLKPYSTTQHLQDGDASTTPSQQHLLKNPSQQHIITMTLSMTIVITTLLYRYRYRVSKMVYAGVVLAIWKPIQEILHAIRNP